MCARQQHGEGIHIARTHARTHRGMVCPDTNIHRLFPQDLEQLRLAMLGLGWALTTNTDISNSYWDPSPAKPIIWHVDLGFIIKINWFLLCKASCGGMTKQEITAHKIVVSLHILHTRLRSFCRRVCMRATHCIHVSDALPRIPYATLLFSIPAIHCFHCNNHALFRTCIVQGNLQTLNTAKDKGWVHQQL